MRKPSKTGKRFETVRRVFTAMWQDVKIVFDTVIYHVCDVIKIAMPYVMLKLGMYTREAETMTGWLIAAILLLPILVYMFTWIMQSYANQIGKGDTVPIPTKRFTTCSEDGEVTVEQSRVQELLLYVADVEDWLNKRGMLSNE